MKPDAPCGELTADEAREALVALIARSPAVTVKAVFAHMLYGCGPNACERLAGFIADNVPRTKGVVAMCLEQTEHAERYKLQFGRLPPNIRPVQIPR